ncbi:ROK family transcriptional regulator [Kaistia geumhonensis]|uniref:NBD/HSP70 family sugar kinase n=1 Tax=Kaistia geumhonensis TaxID=410839 RepID=A0ABU0M4I1_9HYPH|nr:ROK family transcriptional regulator [Kaistia geumhonensis]MCX5478920.1 ROK family transcriptional regulator [Kaistia geumhonensis]MDQ0515861.1 putative NBD/HSP70 family sugar kinase [Kaistia geumhonensis]
MNDLTGSNSELAASHNRGVILRAIQRHQPISRTELAQRSGLTKQTVTRIAERLIGEKLVLEARRRHGQPGQPSIELEINPDGCHSIGAYIARDHVAVVAIDASGAVRGRIHTEVAFALPEQAIGLIEEALATFKRRRTIDERRLAGLGIALPDWLGEIPFPGMPAAYASWTGYDVRGRVAAFTDLPLYIENDAIAAAIGELNYGLGVESRSFFYIFIGSGLGGAVVLDGVCHHGVTGLSGEIGWLPTLVADMPEGSRIQPLGQLVSLYVLYEFMAAHGITITAPAELLSLDLRGRALVSDWLRRAARYIADAAIHIGLLIDPDAVLIGGRLPVRLLDEMLSYVSEYLARDPRPAPAIHRAAGSEDATALGAATMPLAEVLRLESYDPAQRTRLPLTGLPPAGPVMPGWAETFGRREEA